MNYKSTEKGQALIIVAFAAIILFGFAALAIDGSRNFSQKRQAQNAADTSALAGALAYTRGGDITAVAQQRATSNGFDNNGTDNTVSIKIVDIPVNSGVCPTDALGKEITVTINTTINTTFGRVLGRNTMTSGVTATARGCGYTVIDPFGGAAVAGLNPNKDSNHCAYDSGNSGAAHWTLRNGGVFSNGCAFSKDGDSVTLDPGECVSVVGTAYNFTCMQQNQETKAIPYPSGALKLMPPDPCVSGGIGLPQSSGVTSGSSVTFTNGVYCITDMDALDSKDVILNNAALYVTDMEFNLRFAGGGGFSGTPYSGNGPYSGFAVIVAYNPNVCNNFTDQNVQTMVLRGNSGGTFSGSIFAPSACIDVRGNGDPAGMNTQIIAYNVTSNGTAEVYINYSPNPKLFDPLDPTIAIVK